MNKPYICVSEFLIDSNLYFLKIFLKIKTTTWPFQIDLFLTCLVIELSVLH